MSELTFNGHVNAAMAIARAAQAELDSRKPGYVKPFATTPDDRGPEARDLALSITHLEDAATRYNSSRYRRKGSWDRADPDFVSVD